MKTITTTIVALLLVVSSSIAFAAARSWDMDKAHSGIYFSIDHIFSKCFCVAFFEEVAADGLIKLYLDGLYGYDSHGTAEDQ